MLHSRQVLLGAPKPGAHPTHSRRQLRAPLNYVKAASRGSSKANKMPTSAGLMPGYGQDANDVSQDVGERGERGYRRRKLAAMAGNLYRSGHQAVTEFRDSYVQSRGRGADDFGANESTHIPGAFPDVAITSQGNEQMVLFPSYGKRHAKRDWAQAARNQSSDQPDQRNEEWWRQEWEKHEDEKAIVDVDVRGWIYSPHIGPMTRRNRILIGLARQLSGISAPRTDQGYASAGSGSPELKSQHQIHEEVHDQEKIEREAAVIEKRGQEEKRVAYAGGYSEHPQDNNNLHVDAAMSRQRQRGSYTPDSAPGSPSLSARQPSVASELTDAELVVANANLMARVAPFLTNPHVAMPITIFFYNETKSHSKTVLTDDAGHFNVRAALEFIPNHVRVLANEKLSATQEVKITEPAGVSLISDIDDTIKRSNISGGAREIFRNTFVRDLDGLCIDGVREWYTDMHKMGVSMHYCSNSPWQLFPVLASFFKIAGLPPGSLHLKQYSGMLQGIFEPVAERKKTTLNRLIKDFPNRKFLLVGDSGEADLEVYTELVLANPGRILAIFIRDVTTPETTGYFDHAVDFAQRKVSSMTLDDGHTGHARAANRQNSAPGRVSEETESTGPVMGTLIDFSDEPEQVKLDESAALAQVKQYNSGQGSSAAELLATKKPPPPRPAKPVALRSTRAQANVSAVNAKAGMPPPKPKRPHGLGAAGLQPLTTIPSADQVTAQKPQESESLKQDPAPPPLPRRRSGLKSLSPRLFGRGGSSSNADVDFEPLPPAAAPPPPSFGFSYYRAGSRSGSTTPSGSPTLGAQGVNKKLELWRRRLLRAHELLGGQGVTLYTWRTGHDVIAEAMGIVKNAQEDMMRQQRRQQ
ncbi:hypothetical protein QQS21_000547 [Conoideocrella luteorostrata]|uniref:Phosphatidate phosphatase APP1 catalytic domain-containing protein n=1 Tax=Conoideocrella luteorostrata TaxID=1105319 RepID=A0AAJ0FYD4_9HYPO|nr:hypothetical protein QQS21_000547 [Conoideocrella luteorostrata]